MRCQILFLIDAIAEYHGQQSSFKSFKWTCPWMKKQTTRTETSTFTSKERRNPMVPKKTCYEGSRRPHLNKAFVEGSPVYRKPRSGPRGRVRKVTLRRAKGNQQVVRTESLPSPGGNFRSQENNPVFLKKKRVTCAAGSRSPAWTRLKSAIPRGRKGCRHRRSVSRAWGRSCRPTAAHSREACCLEDREYEETASLPEHASSGCLSWFLLHRKFCEPVPCLGMASRAAPAAAAAAEATALAAGGAGGPARAPWWRSSRRRRGSGTMSSSPRGDTRAAALPKPCGESSTGGD